MYRFNYTEVAFMVYGKATWVNKTQTPKRTLTETGLKTLFVT